MLDMNEYLNTLNRFQDAHALGNASLCSYLSYDSSKATFINEPPRNSAVQIAAAITAHARIYMYPFLSRADCFYTDTDSVVLSSPLPEELISSTELGKFKLEYRVREGIFIAPLRAYCFILFEEEKGDILVHKGAAKQHVTREWYNNQYSLKD